MQNRACIVTLQAEQHLGSWHACIVTLSGGYVLDGMPNEIKQAANLSIGVESNHLRLIL